MKQKRLLVALTMMAFSTSLYGATTSVANDAAPQATSESSTWSTIKKRASIGYTADFVGSSFNDLNGGGEDNGDITMINYLSLSYKVASKWKLKGTVYNLVYLRDYTAEKEAEAIKNNKGQELDSSEWGNVYLTASNSRITASKKYGTQLSGYVRYYMPTSKGYVNNPERRNGRLRVAFFPSKSFLDGVITANSNMYNTYYMSDLTNVSDAKANDFRKLEIAWTPGLDFEHSSKFSSYVYYTNVFKLRRDNRWDKWTANDYLEFGMTYKPIKKLRLTPYFIFGSGSKAHTIGNTTINFAASYSI